MLVLFYNSAKLKRALETWLNALKTSAEQPESGLSQVLTGPMWRLVRNEAYGG
jgi:hypothetical protein